MCLMKLFFAQTREGASVRGVWGGGNCEVERGGGRRSWDGCGGGGYLDGGGVVGGEVRGGVGVSGNLKTTGGEDE